MRRNGILALLFLLLLSCGDGTLQSNGMRGDVQRAQIEGAEVFYVSDGLGVARLEATDEFDHVEFHLSLADAQIRVLDRAGAIVADWTDVGGFVDDEDPAAHEGTVNLPTAGHVVELRMETQVDFARVVVGPGHTDGHEAHADEPEGAVSTRIARAGRWMPPANVVAAGNAQYLPYSGAPSRCSGTFLPGTRALAEHLKATFAGAVSYGGYNCRPNTADPSKISVHGSGRAIDLYVPLDRGQADNDLGDAIANHLVANAQRLGIEFIVWDRTSWGAHRAAPKHRYYGGPHPHHDHLHIELAPWAAGGGSGTFDKSPRGYLDGANCNGIYGWAQDPDAPHDGIKVYVSIGGPVFTEGAVGAWAVANERRVDLCSAINSCNHGWYVKVPHGLMDGVARPVYAYGEDVTGGRNSQLSNAPKMLKCSPPQLPYGPNQAVRRHVQNPESLAAWGFQWNDIITVSDAVLQSYPVGAALPLRPTLRSDGAPVYLVEGNTKRHVPNPRAMNAWGLDWGAIKRADTSAMQTARPLEQRPYLIRGSGPGVFLVWPK